MEPKFANSNEGPELMQFEYVISLKNIFLLTFERQHNTYHDSCMLYIASTQFYNA